MRHVQFVPARAAFLLAALSACGPSSTGSTLPTQRTETIHTGGGSRLTVNPDNGATTRIIAAPLEKLWRFLPTAYDSVGVQLTVIDPKKYMLGNDGFKVRQTLGKRRLSTFFECGTTQVGPNADSYELYVTMHTSLEADGPTRTKLTTRVTAAAKPMQFAQDYSRCSTKGGLEARIAEIMTATAAK